MPNVDGKEFPYTKKGKADAKKAMKKKKGKKPMKMTADDGGSMTGKMDPNREKVLDAIKSNNSKPTPSMKGAMNNTSAPKPPTPPQAAMGAAPPAAAGGMGMPPKKPPMPGMKKGGKVKKGGSCGGYKKGGKVRGAGIAKQGVRACKMR